ncbi:hypothetical protein ACUIJN_20355 [Metabacillus halosaccharovorans]|uniref:hypothetical protein n=1 Tax=Metabacillus halosaccharovorans TaxID=930124 RepID=UPI00403D74D4
MSVSLTMIPVALALRVVMGKERFNNWIESMELPKKTNFKSQRDLISTVKQSGYDAEKWGSMIKTHIRGEKEFFFWEVRDGSWQAIFSKYDSRQMIENFMQTLEQRANRRIFIDTEENLHDEIIAKKVFPTNFYNMDLLKQVLQDNDMYAVQDKNDQIICDLGNAQLLFQQSHPESLITVELVQTADMEAVFRHLSLLDEDYKHYIQDRAYQDMKEKAEEKGLTIENEQILEDNSIVLTLSIQR